MRLLLVVGIALRLEKQWLLLLGDCDRSFANAEWKRVDWLCCGDVLGGRLDIQRDCMGTHMIDGRASLVSGRTERQICESDVLLCGDGRGLMMPDISASVRDGVVVSVMVGVL